MESWVTKVICLSILFATTLFCGLLPIQLVRILQRHQTWSSAGSRVKFLLSILNCFAGGVFLGTTFLHMIPEVRADVNDMLSFYGQQTSFAVPEFIICCGFFLIMIVENVVMVLQHHQTRVRFDSIESTVSCYAGSTTPLERSAHDDLDEYAPIVHTDTARAITNGESQMSYGSITNDNEPKAGISGQSQAIATDDTPDVNVMTGRTGFDQAPHQKEYRKQRHHHHHHHHHHHDHHKVVEVSDDTQTDPTPLESCTGHHPVVKVEKGDCVHVIHPSHHQHHHTEPEQLASLRSLLLLLALSLHTVFEGIAIGLEPTSTSVWNLFIAIVVHKCIIAFSMGVQFAESLKTFRRAILFMVLFAFMSPIGVAIGTTVFSVGGSSTTSSTASAVMQAIAAGTFLYVTFFEVLNKEIGQDHSLLKVLFIILGFGAMVLLNLFNGETTD